MNLLAALTTGAVVYLATGWVTGNLPALRPRSSAARGRRGRAQSWLLQAGVGLSPLQFWAGSIAVGITTFALFAAATAPLVAVVPALSATLLPRMWFAKQRVQRVRAVQRDWPDGLREIMAGISAGMSLPQAVGTLARSGSQPLRDAFARFPTLARMVGVVPALEVVKSELADPTSDRVIEVLILAHQRGGRIVNDVLDDLAVATAEDVRTIEEVSTEGLEQRINARAVFVLPWLALLVLTARPGQFQNFYRSGGGIIVVAIGALLSLLGMWLVGRLARDPLEERVLSGPGGGSGGGSGASAGGGSS